MAITLNDNIRINAGKPSEPKYLSTGNTTYASITAVNAAIPIAERHIGLTVLIDSGTSNIEHWYKEGVSDSDLIEKKFNTIIPTNNFITGATNLGYFSGQTGIQTLPITNLSDSDYTGNYDSLYNFYFRANDGKIYADVPSDGIFRRGYLKSSAPVKSWIWNEYTGSSNMLGWILIDGDISQQLGTFQNGVIYYTGASEVYVETGWTTGNAYSNSSDVGISTVVGSLTTGSTLAIGGRPYDFALHNNLHFRTIVSETPTLVKIRDDESFIYISGTTSVISVTGATNGLTKSGQRIILGGALTGNTVITLPTSTSLSFTDNRTPTIGIQYTADYSAGYTARSLVDAAYVTGITNNGALIKGVCNLTVQSYSITRNDFYIGTSGGSIVTLLPNINGAPINGMVITVADVIGNASPTCYVQINGAFFGGGSTACINTAFGSISFLYNGGKTCWSAIAFSTALVV